MWGSSSSRPVSALLLPLHPCQAGFSSGKPAELQRAPEGPPRSLSLRTSGAALACGMAGPLLLFTGGKPRVELYELVMAFLLGQELIQEVWRVLLELSSGLLAWRFLCRGPGLGTNKVTPRGLNADRVPPVPSGPLLWSLFPPMTVGTSSCLAIPFPLSPRALNAVCSVLQFGTQLGVVGGTGCPRATLTVSVSTADTELRNIMEVRAPITAFFRRPRLQMVLMDPQKGAQGLRDGRMGSQRLCGKAQMQSHWTLVGWPASG